MYIPGGGVRGGEQIIDTSRVSNTLVVVVSLLCSQVIPRYVGGK